MAFRLPVCPLLVVIAASVTAPALAAPAAPAATPPLSASQLRQSTANQALPDTSSALAAPTLPSIGQTAVPAAASMITITLGTTGDFDRKTVTYGCTGDAAELTVDYINAAPNYLALIPIDGTVLVFNTVLSGSGAKYAAGKYIWWNKGDETDLYDLTQGANAKPILVCNETSAAP